MGEMPRGQMMVLDAQLRTGFEPLQFERVEVERDDTPYGRDGDHCPWCGRDWKQPHDRECQEWRGCQYPPGCDEAAAPGRKLCRPHYTAVAALFAPREG